MTAPIAPETPEERQARRARRYQEILDELRLEERREDISPIEDFSLGVTEGLGKTGTAAARGVGWLGRKIIPGKSTPTVTDLITGAEPKSALERWADRTDAEMEEYYDGQGTAGTVGKIAGRITGEVGTAMGGSKLIAGALTKFAPATAAARAIVAGRQGTAAQRVAANTLPFAPVDALMGAGGSEKGFVLPGRGGAAVESVLMGAVPSAGIEYGMARRDLARQAQRAGEAAAMPSIADLIRQMRPGEDPLASIGRMPLDDAPRLAPETRPERMLPAQTEIPTAQHPLAGPGIPMPGAGGRTLDENLRLLEETKAEAAQALAAREARKAALLDEPASPTSQLLRTARDGVLEAQARAARSAEIPVQVPPAGADTRPLREIIAEFNAARGGNRSGIAAREALEVMGGAGAGAVAGGVATGDTRGALGGAAAGAGIGPAARSIVAGRASARLASERASKMIPESISGGRYLPPAAPRIPAGQKRYPGDARTSSMARLDAQGNRIGGAQAAVVNTLGGAAAGATAGALTGDTPEEKRRNTVVGLAIGAGGGAALNPLLRVASKTPKVSSAFTADPDVAAVAATIRRGKRPTPAPKNTLLNWAGRGYQKYVNESYAAEAIGRMAGTGADVKQAVARGHGWQGAAEQFLADEFKPVLQAAKGMEEDVMALLKAQRAIDLAARGVADKTPIPLATHQRARAVLERRAPVKAAAEQLRGFYRRLLELKRDGNVISPQQFDDLVASEDFYTPFVREWDDRGTAIGKGGGGKNVQRGTGVRKMSAEQQARADTVDPFEVAVQDAGETFRSIAKQRVTDAVVGAYQANPQLVEPFLRPIAANAPITPGGREVVANLGGTRMRWEVRDPDLYDAFGAFDPTSMNAFVKLLALGKRGLQTGVTLMPDFAAANLTRDIQGAAIQQRGLGRSVAGSAAAGAAGNVAFGDERESIMLRTFKGAGFGAAVGAVGPQAVKNLRAVGDIVGQSADYKQFLREGGYTMGFYPKNAKDARQVLDRLRESGVSMSDVVSPSRWVDLVTSIGRVAEQSTRLAKWKEVRAAGGDVGERVLGAQDVSLRFSQMGKDTKGIAATTAFWNAKVQGWDKLVRMLRQPKTWAMGAAAITAPSLALWETNKDNPEYWARPQWERNMFWLVPKGGEGGGFWRVPKPFEIGFLFGSLPERLADYAANREMNIPGIGPITSASPFKGMSQPSGVLGASVKGMLGTTLDGALPIPTVPLAIAEQAFNHDTFRDRKIVSRPDIPTELQSDEYTSSLGLLAGKLGVSPQRFDKAVKDLTGSSGALALQGLDALARELGLDERAPAPNARRPLVGRFETQPGLMSDAENMLRDRFEKVEQYHRGGKELEKRDASDDEILAYVTEHEDSLREFYALRDVVELANRIRDARREMGRRPGLTDEQRERIASNSGAVLNELAAHALRGDLSPDTP